ncbi:MAG: adenylate/guanylate cyclase domain-containing protein [Chitinophagaceae bacterium]|nr:MAG: adenylate/guanylate cyclase domain-containing protein [Chitinophagaceae bacterium]
MKNVFNKKFEEEFLISEKLRTTILAGVFLLGILGSGTILIFFSNNGSDELHRSAMLRVFFFQLSLFVFEVLALLYIIRRIRKNLQSIPVAGQYLNMAIEISAPPIIMFLLSQHYDSPGKILHSPIVNIYFVFIILSTLRLDFRLSLFAGLLAATGFFILSVHLIGQSEVNQPGGSFRNDYVIAVAKSTGLLISGISAAFVAKQIRQGINRSLKVAEEANKVVDLFGQQISKEIVDEMLQNDGDIKSKMMQVCVMFIDIRNFTKYAAGKTPVEIVKYQNAFFSIIVNVVSKHHGIVNQFLGDGCMVTFGAPAALKNPSEHAVRAAMEIQHELNKEITRGNIPLTSIGIGIHTGDAVTGNIGNRERQQYSITGNVVILASRIEQLNKVYQSQILISEEVNESITGSEVTNAEFLGKVDLKGWSIPVGIYKVA